MSYEAAIRHAATCGMDALLNMAVAKARLLDDDVDSPAEGCPACIEQGLLKTRAQLETALLAAKEQASRMREIWCRRIHDLKPALTDEEIQWADEYIEWSKL